MKKIIIALSLLSMFICFPIDPAMYESTEDNVIKKIFLTSQIAKFFKFNDQFAEKNIKHFLYFLNQKEQIRLKTILTRFDKNPSIKLSKVIFFGIDIAPQHQKYTYKNNDIAHRAFWKLSDVQYLLPPKRSKPYRISANGLYSYPNAPKYKNNPDWYEAKFKTTLARNLGVLRLNEKSAQYLKNYEKDLLNSLNEQKQELINNL